MFTEKKCFEILSKKFYHKNFGLTSKAEIELHMFFFYTHLETNINKSDFEIAKDLGITLTRVRNLRERSHFLFTEHYDLSKEFLFFLHSHAGQFTEKSVIEKEGHTYLLLNITDRILFFELENHLNELHLLYDRRLSRYLIEIKVEDFFKLLENLVEPAIYREFQARLKPDWKSTLKGKMSGITTEILTGILEAFLTVAFDRLLMP